MKIHQGPQITIGRKEKDWAKVEDLRKRSGQDWSDLKYTLKPSSLSKEAVDHFIDKKWSDRKGRWTSESNLSYGIATLAQKLVEKATTKFGKKTIPRKIIDFTAVCNKMYDVKYQTDELIRAPSVRTGSASSFCRWVSLVIFTQSRVMIDDNWFSSPLKILPPRTSRFSSMLAYAPILLIL